MFTSSRLTILLVAALLAVGCKAFKVQDEELVASESNVQQQAVPAVKPVLKLIADVAQNAYQLGQASKTYLDTQPEFTQSWADFPYAPGYLPGAYRTSHVPYQQQQSQYKQANGALSQNTIGYGYIDWSGPVNPANLYLPINLPYYYRIPPQSVFYMPNAAIYQPIVKPVYQHQAPAQQHYQQPAPVQQHQQYKQVPQAQSVYAKLH